MVRSSYAWLTWPRNATLTTHRRTSHAKACTLTVSERESHLLRASVVLTVQYLCTCRSHKWSTSMQWLIRCLPQVNLQCSLSTKVWICRLLVVWECLLLVVWVCLLPAAWECHLLKSTQEWTLHQAWLLQACPPTPPCPLRCQTQASHQTLASHKTSQVLPTRKKTSRSVSLV